MRVSHDAPSFYAVNSRPSTRPVLESARVVRALSAARVKKEPTTSAHHPHTPATASALVTLNSARVPLVFQIVGSGDSVEISWGVLDPEGRRRRRRQDADPQGSAVVGL